MFTVEETVDILGGMRLMNLEAWAMEIVREMMARGQVKPPEEGDPTQGCVALALLVGLSSRSQDTKIQAQVDKIIEESLVGANFFHFVYA